MKINFSLFLFLLLNGALFSQNLFESDKNEILKILEDQRLAWNKGDLKEYMNGYWQSDSLRFIGKNGIIYGWNNTLDRYAKAYPAKQTMGNLTFEVISLEKLNDCRALMVGRWMLNVSDKNISGCFTLIWQKIEDKWKIILDHSS